MTKTMVFWICGGNGSLVCSQHTSPTFSLPLYRRPSAQYLLFLVSSFFFHQKPPAERTRRAGPGWRDTTKEQGTILYIIFHHDDGRM